ncbi:MAG: ATP phosphoribosyltransferase, partial [Rhodobacterales bacterium 12-65-15]
MQDTFDWFGARGVHMRRSGADREYSGVIEGITGAVPVLLSAGEVPRELAAGRIHLGVTGSDLVTEELGPNAPEVVGLSRLGFGQADLILAVPNVWIDVETVDDLDAAAAGFRATHGHRLRIATKYHRLVRDFLQAQGVADYTLVDSQGATTAEAIADITSSGETLRANHLRVLSDGLIHQSEAVLWASTTAGWTEADRAVMVDLADLLAVRLPFAG